MKKLIERILAKLAEKILKKYKPEIIGITGSVGKTSTKEAIFTVLKNKFNVRKSIKNYNTEVGVPLTIIGVESPGKSIFKWLPVFFKALHLILKRDKFYPEILVLEMAADHPGDIEYLVKLAPCKVGVVTAIGPTHLKFFGEIRNVIQEKEKLVSHLDKNSWAVLNADDKLVVPMQKNIRARIITYGLKPEADISAESINYEVSGLGMSCKLIVKKGFIPAEVQADFKNVIASSQLSSLLAGVAVGLIYDIPLTQATLNLQTFKFPKGRLSLIKGIKSTLIIDDTYNSSPKAVKVALEVLSRIRCKGRRWAVLGDMLELGGYTETAHQEVGEWIKQFKVDILVTVGERSTETAKVAEINGLEKEKVYNFETSKEAGKFIQKEIEQGDLILVKGSQGMRMEKIVKEIMAEPNRAEELLVRQDKEWIEK